MGVCIYTAIYGDYDDLKAQPVQSVPTDFICFTESTRLHARAPWTIIRNNRLPGLHPCMRAKYYKVLSHRIFPNGRLSLSEAFTFGLRRVFTPYDYTIWIDGNAQIRTSVFAETVISYIGQSGWAMFDHPERDCIYDEMVVSARMPKYHELPLAAQVESYRAEGHPSHNGLKACGVIARDARSQDLRDVNETWWQENLKWSFQDQLSLPVTLRRLGKSCDTIEGCLWRNDLVEWAGHTKDSVALVPSPGPSVELTEDTAAPFYYVDQIGTVVDPINKQTIQIEHDASLLVTGWAVDALAATPAGGVDVVVDSQPFAAAYGLPRRDVAEYFQCSRYLNTGYSFALPAAFLGKGKHQLAVRVISADQTSFRQGTPLAIKIK